MTPTTEGDTVAPGPPVGDPPTPVAPAPPREGFYLLELIGLTAVVITQPVLDIVAEAPEEFVLRNAGVLLVVAYALVVALGPALVLWAAEQPLRLIGARVREVAHAVVLGSGVGVFVTAGAKSALGGEARPRLVVVGLVAAGAATVLLLRTRMARQVLRYVAVALPVFLALFLFASPVADLVLAGGVEAADVEVEDPVPVIVVILDELPTMSLLDGAGEVDAAHFPAFADLAAGSTWYRNATTVAPVTLTAVPAILTGQVPEDSSAAPVAANYDESLFTLLGDTYDIRAAEALTRLCPAAVCDERVGPDGPSSVAALRALLRITGGVLGDVVSPWVDQRDADFGVGQTESEQAGALGLDRPEAFPQEPYGDGGASLDVAHVLLPHQPWVWLPSGRTYAAPHPVRGAEFGTWFDQVSADEGRRRHLAQLQYTDTLLGESLDRLRAEPWYEDALLVVTADHGVSFTDQQPTRGVSEGNYAETLWVPLFVKYPGQDEGAVDDRPAETVDIVPTVADVVGADLPWEVDGVSLRDAPRDRPARVVEFRDNTVTVVDGVATLDREAGFTQVLDAPGPARGAPAGDRYAFARPGPYGDLVGTELDPEAVTDEPGPELTTTEDTAAPTFVVAEAATKLPAYVEGTWAGPPGDWVAVTVDGTVAGLGLALPQGEDGATFWTLLTEDRLGPGEHELGAYRVTGPPDRPRYQAFTLSAPD